MLGNHQKAEQAYRKALEIDRDEEEAAYELQAGKMEKKALATD